jgi:8-oxo-dGTP pyrophosphatase MutT (NUDIX family)
MSKERRITTRGIIFKDGKMLAQELMPARNGQKRDYWCTPGGGLEAGESLHAGLEREMIEETGITPVIGKLLFIQQYEDEEKEFLEFFFHITNADDYETIDLSTTSHGEIEVENVDFIVPHEHNVLPAFLQTIDIQAYIDTDLPVVMADLI